jgi:hypothetical protein
MGKIGGEEKLYLVIFLIPNILLNNIAPPTNHWKNNKCDVQKVYPILKVGSEI